MLSSANRETPAMYTWNPQDYAQHSRSQEAWARELLTQIDLKPDDVVLDVGCGDGRNTAAIANSVPNGSVVGVDLSANTAGRQSTICASRGPTPLRYSLRPSSPSSSPTRRCIGCQINAPLSTASLEL
jgi:cyclopropane fatty-acyl-phospholipid synthase-like methyltransferase